MNMKIKVILKAIAIFGSIAAAIVMFSILLVALFAGYKFTEGYWKAGTWNNDPNNYERAFNSKQPKEIKVINSKYTRYPHFTLEQEMYFEFVLPDSIKRNWIKNGWDTVSVSDKNELIEKIKYNSPTWFIAESLTKYKLYYVVNESYEFPNNIMAIDTTTGHIFYYSIQL